MLRVFPVAIAVLLQAMDTGMRTGSVTVLNDNRHL